MTHKRAATTVFHSVAAMLAFAHADPAAADDFTFQIPLEVSNFAPGATDVFVTVTCFVSSRFGSGQPSARAEDVVGRSGPVVVRLGPGPVNTSQVVTVAFNAASPRLRPASEGRYYACRMEAGLSFPEGGPALSLHGGTFSGRYAAATGHRLTTLVTRVQGEVPRQPVSSADVLSANQQSGRERIVPRCEQAVRSLFAVGHPSSDRGVNSDRVVADVSDRTTSLGLARQHA